MQWFIHADGAQYGPADTEVLENWIRNGSVRIGHFIWDFDAAQWIHVEEHPAFLHLFTDPRLASTLSALKGAPSSIAIPSSHISSEQEIHFPIPVGPDGQRRHARTRVKVTVRWEPFPNPHPELTFKARAFDISFGGVSFLATKAPKIGDKVKIHFDIPDGRKPFVVTALVRRNIRSMEPGHYSIGCQFTNLDDPAKSFLLDRLEAVYSLAHDDGAET